MEMNQLCKVCAEPAAGFHFGAFTCEGCKSFFGRTYNNLSQIHECKNGGQCVINKQNRTSCKACRLRKCLRVGMSKSGSRYGRRSNWFKIHCLLQEQAANLNKGLEPNSSNLTVLSPANMPYSPVKVDDDQKTSSPAISSPDSIASDLGIENDHKNMRKSEFTDVSSDVKNCFNSIPDTSRRQDIMAGLSFYGIHPGISLLHASQLYTRFYSPVFYPGIGNPLFIPPVSTPSSPQQTSPSHDPSPKNSPPPPESSPPAPTEILTTSKLSLSTVSRKREADSSIEELRSSLSQVSSWPLRKGTEQDVPIDLSVKKQRPPPPPSPVHVPVSPPASPAALQRVSLPGTVIPVDLTTKA